MLACFRSILIIGILYNETLKISSRTGLNIIFSFFFWLDPTFYLTKKLAPPPKLLFLGISYQPRLEKKTGYFEPAAFPKLRHQKKTALHILPVLRSSSFSASFRNFWFCIKKIIFACYLHTFSACWSRAIYCKSSRRSSSTRGFFSFSFVFFSDNSFFRFLR